MTAEHQQGPAGTILLIGASRGLGAAMAAEFLHRRWTVIATVRGTQRIPLHDLADSHPGRITIEPLDVTAPDQIAALRSRLADRRVDILFVNAGVASTDGTETVATVSTEEFMRVMVTNALSPLRAIEGLQDVVAADGLIGVMSSGQGSIANNSRGGHEVYRGSKAALNQLMRCYAARHASDGRALLLLAPGWIRTELGGV